MGFTLTWWRGLRTPSETRQEFIERGVKNKASPTNMGKKTMTMTTIQNKNRTGIYVQESGGATTAGDGLAPKGVKSPVEFKKESDVYVILSDDEKVFPHYSGQSRANETKEEHTSDQNKSILARGKLAKKRKYKTDLPTKRTRRDRDSFYKNRYTPIVNFFRSPAIKAGATEAESSYSPQGLKRRKQKDRQIIKELKINGMHIARTRMGMRASCIRREFSPDDSPTRTKDEDCHIEVLVIDRANPFKEIERVNQMLLLNALQATVQDERSAGNFVKLGRCKYRKRILVAPCKNEETVRFLKNNIPCYNRLWPGADLMISMEPVVQKRFKVKVHLPDYNITSEEFFKMIGKQNGFPSKYWSLIARREIDGFIAFIGVDLESYTRLKQSDGYAYFFYDRIKFELDVK